MASGQEAGDMIETRTALSAGNRPPHTRLARGTPPDDQEPAAWKALGDRRRAVRADLTMIRDQLDALGPAALLDALGPAALLDPEGTARLLGRLTRRLADAVGMWAGTAMPSAADRAADNDVVREVQALRHRLEASLAGTLALVEDPEAVKAHKKAFRRADAAVGAALHAIRDRWAGAGPVVDRRLDTTV